MHQIDEMGAQVGNGTVAEFAVAVPAGEQIRVEGSLGQVHEKLIPIDVFLAHVLLEVMVPIGLLAVADLLDARGLAQHARLPQRAEPE